MIQLPDILAAWGRADFDELLKAAIAKLGIEDLPLQEGLVAGSFALEEPLDMMVIHSTEKDDCIEAKVGIFYKSLMPGCACAGDPTVESEQNEHITVLVSIDKPTAETTLELLDD